MSWQAQSIDDRGQEEGISEAPEAVALPYRLRWRPRTQRPGAHPALGDGGEGSFRGLLPLLARPDPRRLDVRAYIRDPFENLKVRTFAPRRAVTVTALLDTSGSMGFGILRHEVARLVGTLAASAVACGDAFGLLGADAAVRQDLHMPAAARRGLAQEAMARVRAASFGRRGASGLLAAATRLSRHRGLVFLVSDFLMPRAELSDLLDALIAHDVVPVVVRDSRAEGHVPSFGLLEAIDAETGGRRLIFVRPSLRARWQQEARARLEALDGLFLERGMTPFHLIDRFDPDALLDFLQPR